MKKIMIAAMVLALAIPALVSGQNEGLGDDFSLEGALDLFENANSPEDFERKINLENSNVNNLDLDNDGQTDYITVSDEMVDDVHAIVLSVHVSKDEVQDVAVIEIEKTGKESALLQIVGSEDVFGEEIIVEPFDERTVSKGTGPSADIKVEFVVVNVWLWPSVRFVYAPAYRPWISPWRYRVYPKWWKPWRPYSVATFRVRRHVPFGFRRVTTHRVVRAHKVYIPRKRSSSIVRTSRKVTVRKGNDTKVVKSKKTKTKVTRKDKKSKAKVTRKKKVVK